MATKNRSQNNSIQMDLENIVPDSRVCGYCFSAERFVLAANCGKRFYLCTRTLQSTYRIFPLVAGSRRHSCMSDCQRTPRGSNCLKVNIKNQEFLMTDLMIMTSSYLISWRRDSCTCQDSCLMNQHQRLFNHFKGHLDQMFFGDTRLISL